VTDGVVQYKFLSLVGEGGFGRVYRARLQVGEFSKDVAIKLLSDPDPPRSLLERFRDEAKILGLIRDRAIVGVEPPVRISGRWAMVMEFVDGVSCGLMLGYGRLPVGVAVEIVGEVARALHAAYHQEGPEGEPLNLLHRDIKPENIQITPSGDVRILDFGIARANFAAREFKTRHSLGGTPGYIAPERLNRVEVPEGDVFSLGVVLHELVTGDRPKHPPTVEVDTQIQHGSEDEELPSAAVRVDEEELEIPDDLRDDPLVMGVLRFAAWMRAYDPTTRPSAREVEEACRTFRQKLPPPYFRNWAESHVPHRMELDADEMVGQVLTTQHHMSSHPLVMDSPVPSGPPSHPPTGGSQSNTGVAMGALLGGSVTLLVVLGLGALIVAVGLGLFYDQTASEPVAQGTGPAPVAARADDNMAPGTPPGPENPPSKPREPAVAVEEPTADDLGTDPKPTVTPPPRPTPPPVAVAGGTDEPEPEPIPKGAKVISYDPEAADDGTPAPEPEPVRVRQRTMVPLFVKMLPSGGEVRWNSQVLPSTAPGRYELPAGDHFVTLVAPSGEQHHLAVKAGSRPVYVCWNFDENRKCSE